MTARRAKSNCKRYRQREAGVRRKRSHGVALEVGNRRAGRLGLVRW
jgi:hypothetical protein